MYIYPISVRFSNLTFGLTKVETDEILIALPIYSNVIHYDKTSDIKQWSILNFKDHNFALVDAYFEATRFCLHHQTISNTDETL